jgi:hypothetical protein
MNFFFFTSKIKSWEFQKKLDFFLNFLKKIDIYYDLTFLE